MQRPEPDLTGFREAQVALIAKLGSDVEFFAPREVSYPDGTILDPETGEPYDPTVAASSSGLSSGVTVKCGIAIGPGGWKGTEDEAIGRFEDGEGVLIVPIADFADVEEATECIVYGDRYEILRTDEDGIASQGHRVIVRIRRKAVTP